jgi:hypothetical protein
MQVHKHDWVKVDGKIVDVPASETAAGSAGTTWVAELALPGEAAFRAEVAPPGLLKSVFPPGIGTVTGFLINKTSHLVRFDMEDPRNQLPKGVWPASRDGVPTTRSNVAIAGSDDAHTVSDEDAVAPELRSRLALDKLLGGEAGLIALIDKTVAAAQGPGDAQAAEAPQAGPMLEVADGSAGGV